MTMDSTIQSVKPSCAVLKICFKVLLASVCGLILCAVLVRYNFYPSRSPAQSSKFAEYLKDFPNYDYNGTLYKLRRTQFGHIPKDEVYLDFTGAGVYQTQQINKAMYDLKHTMKCNTHSASSCSKRTEKAIEEVRQRILKFFNAPNGTYSVIFTQSATAALHLVGDSFPWSNESLYLYAKHNHNSVLGIRQLAKKNNATYQTLDWEYSQKEIVNKRHLSARELMSQYMDVPEDSSIPHHLVAFPGECNFSGIKYPLELIEAFEANNYGSDNFRKGYWHALLDAAAFVPTNPLDLNATPASFVTMSFYKMFGFPTGIGALLVRNDVAALMKKTYFAGGSVVTVSCETDFCQLKPKYSEKFEDGTLDFLSIDQLRHGFDTLEKIGMSNIQEHVWAVTKYFYDKMKSFHHSNGKPLARIYGNHEAGREHQGGIVTFNLLDKYGNYIGYSKIMKPCSEHNFSVRAGCSCNPGACHNFLGLNEEMVEKSSMKRTSCGDEIDMMQGLPLGAVRASFGYPTTIEEVDSFAEFLNATFVDFVEEVRPYNPFE